MAASLPADFTDLPSSCGLDGLYVSYAGAEDLIRAYRKQERDCAISKIDLAKERDIAASQCGECEKRKMWSYLAPPAAFLLGVSIAVGIFVIVEKLK